MRTPLVVVLLSVILAGCAGEPAPISRPTPAAPVAAPLVKYEAEGTVASATMTYTTPTGQSQDEVALPLTNRKGTSGFRWTDFPPGTVLYVSLQNHSDHGSVTCRIVVDTQVVSENTATGAYAIASCQGTAE